MKTNPPVYLPIGRAIQATRGARGLTQARLAEAAGLSRAHLAALEAGTFQPKAETVFSLADALEVTVDQLRTLAPLSGRTAGRTITADEQPPPARDPDPCPRSKSTGRKLSRPKTAGRKPPRPAPATHRTK